MRQASRLFQHRDMLVLFLLVLTSCSKADFDRTGQRRSTDILSNGGHRQSNDATANGSQDPLEKKTSTATKDGSSEGDDKNNNDDKDKLTSDCRLPAENAAVLIGSAAQLATIAASSSLASKPAYYKLTRDLDFTGVPYTPFLLSCSVFDGAGFTIKNLTITYDNPQPTSGNFPAGAIGLFSAALNSTVKNLTLKKTIIHSHGPQVGVGSLVGESSQSTLQDITVIDASVKADAKDDNIGAGVLAGEIVGTTLKNIAVVGGDVSASLPGNAWVGGIAGRIGPSAKNPTSVDHVTSSATVAAATTSRSSVAMVGALFGEIVISNHGMVLIANSSASGNLSVEGSSRTCGGGLVGNVYYGGPMGELQLTEVSSTSTIRAFQSLSKGPLDIVEVGGIVGCHHRGAKLSIIKSSFAGMIVNDSSINDIGYMIGYSYQPVDVAGTDPVLQEDQGPADISDAIGRVFVAK